MEISPEFKLIADWITPQARVLDLGCGDGTLLKYLADTRQVTGYGMELDSEKNIQALEKGINVIQSNLNSDDLNTYFDPDSFDFVVMTQALQVIRRPDILLNKMLSIGKQGIITFPNFGYWKMRSYLMFKGQMPETKAMPYHWYDTPNIHHCTFDDFENLCHKLGLEVVAKAAVNKQHKSNLGMKLWPNMLGEIALYQVKKRS